MYVLAVSARSPAGGKNGFFFACMRLFTMCKMFEFCMTGLNIFVNLYEKVLAGLALCQYNELITVEILYIYCKCCMSTDSQVSNGRTTSIPFHCVIFLSVSSEIKRKKYYCVF